MASTIMFTNADYNECCLKATTVVIIFING